MIILSMYGCLKFVQATIIKHVAMFIAAILFVEHALETHLFWENGG